MLAGPAAAAHQFVIQFRSHRGMYEKSDSDGDPARLS